MDRLTRKHYRQQAAMALGQGWKSMSIQPEHLLDLLTTHVPPPPLSEQQREIARQARLLEERDRRIVELSRAVTAARNEGRADGFRDSAQEIRRLREDVSRLTTERNALRARAKGKG